MASINIGKNNYKDDKSFIPDYVDYVIDKKLEEYDEHMSDTSNPHQVTKAQVGLSNVDNTSDLNKPISNATQVAIDGILENTSIIADENGGFHAGTSSAFISDGTGGAIGYGATTAHGGSAGRAAYSTTGFAGGDQSSTGKGGAAGGYANSSDGFAGGNSAKAEDGGAVGSGAKAGDGFAGGSGAKAVASNGSGIDAIQLGTGTNSVEGTLQVYSYQLLDEEGKIPDARLNDATSDGGLYGRKDGAWERVTKDAIGLSNVDNTSDANKPISAETQAALDAITENTSNIQNSSGGFSAGMTSQAKGGGAVGSGSYANSGFAGGVTAYAGFGGAVGAYAQVTGGGAVGQNAVTSDGFAGGKNAIAGEDYSNGIDAIQLGTGTNSTPKTMQVYGYQLLDANGKIPKERLREEGGGFAAGEGSSAGAGGAIGDSAIATTGGAAGENAETSTGFAGGAGAESVTGGAVGAGANVTTGGAAGSGAFTTTGGAVGTESSSTAGGGAVGGNTWTTSGGAVGNNARADYGGAVGSNANASYGGAVGTNSKANNGGAIGNNAVSGAGFAGGDNAKAVDSSGIGIDAIQLGIGTNNTPKTLQVYGHQLLDANGKIPDARLNDAPSDGNTYARKNGIWEAIISGLPSVSLEDLDTLYERGAYVLYYSETYDDGEGYGERTFNYTDLVVISTSNKFAEPNATQTRYTHDGKIYIRGGYTGNTFSGMRWSEVSFADAPSDSNTYARKDGSWEELTDLHTHANKSILDATEVAYTESDQARIGTLENDLDGLYAQVGELESAAVTDAPSDGNTYARKDGAWTNLTRQIAKQLINFVPLEYDGSDVTDLDNLPSGITIVNYADGPGYGGYMVMTSLEGSGYGYQIKISIEGLSYRYNNGTWGSWIKIG